MDNIGYTKIPNAIIRSSELTLVEKIVWCYIASMRDGYRFTVRSACETLHINIKTWRRCIVELERRRMISVKTTMGNTNRYETVKDANLWDMTPTDRVYISNDTLPKGVGVSNGTPSNRVGISNGTPSNRDPYPPPNEYRGTHCILEKNKKKNNVDDDTRACARERFEQEVMIDANIELACMSCEITPAQYKELAEKIIAEWRFKDLQDSEWTKSHFMSVLRYKVADLKRNNHNINKNENGNEIEESCSAASNPLARATIHSAKIG